MSWFSPAYVPRPAYTPQRGLATTADGFLVAASSPKACRPSPDPLPVLTKPQNVS
jgi:hypothetical protein